MGIIMCMSILEDLLLICFLKDDYFCVISGNELNDAYSRSRVGNWCGFKF